MVSGRTKAIFALAFKQAIKQSTVLERSTKERQAREQAVKEAGALLGLEAEVGVKGFSAS